MGASACLAALVVGALLGAGGGASAAVVRRAAVRPNATSAELLTNGNAEATGSGVFGWTPSGGAEVVAYGAPNFPTSTDPGPPSRGKKFFAGGNSASSTFQQTVNLDAFGGQIKTGKVQAQISAYLGGFSDQSDAASIVVHVLQSGTSSEPVLTVAGPNAETRDDVTGLLYAQGDFALPKHATALNVSISFTRASGSFDDGYADNVSVKLVNLNGTNAPPAAPAGASPELLLNGHFDAGTGGTGGLKPIPHWPTDDATAVKYGTPQFPSAAGVVPTDHGANFLAGGVAALSSTLQPLTIPAGYDAAIDRGHMEIQLSEYVGGFGDDQDQVEFLVGSAGSSGAFIAPAISTGPTSDERADITGLWYRATTQIIPPGTRRLEVEYLCVRNTGNFCDGYVDDASLRLLHVPALPTITKIAPTSVHHGGAASITITGTHFEHGATLAVGPNGVSLSNIVVVSATKITATVHAAANASLGAHALSITNPDFGQVIRANGISVT